MRTRRREAQPHQREGAKGYFRATKDGNLGAARRPMNGNQQTALAEAACSDRLLPPTNRVRGETPAPSPARGGVSARGLLNLVWASRPSAARNPAPGPRLRALGAPLASPRRPAPPVAAAPGSARSPSVLSPWVPSIPQCLGGPRTLGTGRKCGRVANCMLSGPPWRPAGGRKRTSGGVVPRGGRQRLSGPSRLTRPRCCARGDRTRGEGRRRRSQCRARAGGAVVEGLRG